MTNLVDSIHQPLLGDSYFPNYSSLPSDSCSSSEKKVSSVSRNLLARSVESTDLGSNIFNTFSNLNQINEDRIRDILNLQKENNQKIRALQDLKQKIRMSGDSIDWTNNDENKALLDKCKEYGLIVADGKYTFTKEEKESLLLNADSTQDRYSLSSEETKLRLSQMFNVKTQTIELWASLLQKCHEMAMAVIRNLRS
jgi:hypothetical protein